MLIAGLALIVIGVLSLIGAIAPWGFDFAVAVTRGWHVTVVPPPLWISSALILTGAAALGGSFRVR